jgi:carbonic anhydrase
MSFPPRLVEGYRTFLSARLPREQARFQELAEVGQSPEVMVIGCCDSRVSPEVIFDAGPGELFVLRNIANLVPPYAPDSARHGVSSALEYAVQALQVRHIVVLGHAQCGGVRAFAEDSAPLSPSDFIGRWMTLLAPAAAAVGPRGDMPLAEYLTRLEQASLSQTLANLLTFPYVRRRVESGSLVLHAAYFGVATGTLSVLDQASSEFRSVATGEMGRGLAPPHF